MGDRHVEFAVAALAGAEDEVGFAYPDQQCFGNLDYLAVMPPYNLYLLLFRNFCGTASLVDRSVFDKGHWFNEELVHGHEDWDYFLTLGKNGVIGVPFHGSPVRWRRWGYSRSDGIGEARGLFLREVRELHSDLFEPERLIDIKRVWAPALSIVIPDALGTVEPQTCADYEVVARDSGVLPRVRGRWVVVLDRSGVGSLGDATFVERALRLLEDRPVPVALGLRAGGDGARLIKWQRAGRDGPGGAVGFAVDGATYAQWVGRYDGATDGAVPDAVALPEVSVPVEWRWVGEEVDPPLRVGDVGRGLPPPLPSPDPDISELEEKDPSAEAAIRAQAEGQSQEEAFRWSAAPLYLPAAGLRRVPVPPSGYVDGFDALAGRAWSAWVPSQTRRIDVLIEPSGRTLLEPVDDTLTTPSDSVPGTQRVPLCRVWSRNFPGTAGLYGCVDLKTHSYAYRAGDEPDDPSHTLMGYVAMEPMTGMVSLQGALSIAANRLLASGQTLLLPLIEAAGAFVEPLGGEGSSQSSSGMRGRAHPTRHRGWPLYEITLEGGGYRYSTSPDDWVAAEDPGRRRLVAVAALAVEGTSLSGATLHEVRYRGLGTYGYVSGPDELAAGVDVADHLKLLGDVTEVPRESVPLVRLHPGPTVTTPPDPPGHRLAIDWQSVVREGFEPEGVVGYVGSPDPRCAPLFRWRGPSGNEWRLTLGTRPTESTGDWVFDGSLGTAWYSGTRRMGLIDLHEMALGSIVTYATDPAEFKPLGFTSRGVVARVLDTRDPGSLPLFRLALDDDSPWLFSPCSDEASELGFVRQGIVGFLGPAVPPVLSVDSWSGHVPPWGTVVSVSDGIGDEIMGILAKDPFPGAVAISREVAGSYRVFVGPASAKPQDTAVLGYAPHRPVPFGVPVYLVKHLTGGGTSYTSTPPDDPERVIESTCCYLLTPQSSRPTGGADEEPAADGPHGDLTGRRDEGRTTRGSRVARLVPPGIRRRVVP